MSAFYLEKQKSFIPKKFLSCRQNQNKKALFTDSFFREGFGFANDKKMLYCSQRNFPTLF